jgi:DNA-binding GntR family transcriptional regulator
MEPVQTDRPYVLRGDAALPHTERVYEEIKWRIVYGQYSPARHLSEATLARLHKVSRTPVREALSRLLEERYVAWEPGRGFVIAPITVAMIRNTFEVRRILEVAAAEAAARSATQEDIRSMRRLEPAPYTPTDVESYKTALAQNMRFHIAVAAASHNDLLVEQIRYCLMHVDRVLSLGTHFANLHKASGDDHSRIVDAVEKHQVAGARRAMAKHLERSERFAMDAVMSGQIRGVAL